MGVVSSPPSHIRERQVVETPDRLGQSISEEEQGPQRPHPPHRQEHERSRQELESSRPHHELVSPEAVCHRGKHLGHDLPVSTTWSWWSEHGESRHRAHTKGPDKGKGGKGSQARKFFVTSLASFSLSRLRGTRQKADDNTCVKLVCL